MIHWLRRLLPRHSTYQSEIAEEIAYPGSTHPA